MGALSLRFDYDVPAAKTRLNVLEQRQPLKVVRAFDIDDGGVLVHLHNLSGGVLAGDRLSTEWEIGPRAQAQLTSTGATRVYRSRSGAPAARHSCRVRVSEDALLEYVPDPLIPFAGSRYEQHTQVDLDHGAGLFWWETVAPGREARGELFSYEALRLGFELRAEGRPIAIERNLLEPGVRQLEPGVRRLESPVRLGPHRYFSSFYICRVGLAENRWREIERLLIELAGQLSSPVIIWGLSRLPAHGLIVRGLSVTGRYVASGLIAFWHLAKQLLYGRDAVIPRKIY